MIPPRTAPSAVFEQPTSPRRRIISGPPASFGDVAWASAQEAYLVENLDSRNFALSEAYHRQAREIYEATGAEIENPYDIDNSDIYPQGSSMVPHIPAPDEPRIGWQPALERRRKAWDVAVADLRLKHPDKTFAQVSVDDLATQLSREAAERAADVRSRADSWTTEHAASLAGGVAGAFADPINIATLPIGFGSRTIVGAVMKEAAVNAGITGGMELIRDKAAWSDATGREYTVEDLMSRVAIGGTFGAVVGGAGKFGQQSAGRLMFDRTAFEVFRTKYDALPPRHPFREDETVRRAIEQVARDFADAEDAPGGNADAHLARITEGRQAASDPEAYPSPGESPERGELRAMLDRGATAEEIWASPLAREVDQAAAGTPTMKAGDPIPEGREYLLPDPESNEPRRAGVEEAADYLADQARMHAGPEGPLQERRAIFVVGYPGAGKSTFVRRFSERTRSAVADTDEAKLVIPEYEGGRGTQIVNNESSALRDEVMRRLVRDGDNLIFETLGRNPQAALEMAEGLREMGYDLEIVHVKVNPEEAVRRQWRRYLDTGRYISPSFMRSITGKVETGWQALVDSGAFSRYLEIDYSGDRSAATASEILASDSPGRRGRPELEEDLREREGGPEGRSSEAWDLEEAVRELAAAAQGLDRAPPPPTPDAPHPAGMNPAIARAGEDPTPENLDKAAEAIEQELGPDVDLVLESDVALARAAASRKPATATELKAAAVEAFGEGADKIFAMGQPLPGMPQNALAFTSRNSGAVTLIEGRVRADQVKGLLLHEIAAHHGLRRILGDFHFEQLLEEVWTRAREAKAGTRWSDIYDDVVERYGEDVSRWDILTEEMLAAFVERHPDLAVGESWWARLVNALKRWWRRATGSKSDLSDADIVELARGAVDARRRRPEETGLSTEGAERRVAMAKGLPMDEASRLARAKAMGFDVDTPVYHGTARGGFEEFDPSSHAQHGLFGQGVYFTDNPDIASAYTNKGAAKLQRLGREPRQTVYRAFVRLQNPIDMDAPADVAAWRKALGEYDDIDIQKGMTNEEVYRALEDAIADQRVPMYEGAEIAQDILRAMGHDGIVHVGGGRVGDGPRHQVKIVFDAENIRSTTAAFDPEFADSANLVFSRGPQTAQPPQGFGQPKQPSPSAPNPAPGPVTPEVARARFIAAKTRAARKRLGRWFAGFRNGSGEADAGEFLQAIVDYQGQGSGLPISVDGLRKTIAARSLAEIEAALFHFRSGFAGRRVNRADLDNFVKEMFGEDTKDASAKALADAVQPALEKLRQRFNRAGGQIGKLERWGLPQSHDVLALRNWIAANGGKVQGRAALKKRLYDSLDVQRMRDVHTGNAMSAQEVWTALDSVVEDMLTDGWATRTPSGAPVSEGALASRRADHRFLIFRDAETWLGWQRDFGAGDPVSALVGHVEAMAKDIAAMEVLGPNPDATIEWLKQKALQQAGQAAVGRPSLLPKRVSSRKDPAQYVAGKIKRMDDMWLNYTGAVNVPVNESLARWSGMTRNLLTSSALGSAIISALPTDPVFQAFARQFAGVSHARMVPMLIRHIKDPRQARKLALIMDHANSTFGDDAKFARDMAAPGWSGVLASQVLAMSGLTPWTRGGRNVFGMGVLGDLGDMSGEAFDQLDPAWQRTFTRYGIGEDEWEAIRAAPLNQDGFATPQAIEQAAGTELADRVLHMILQETEYAVPSGTLRSRSFMRGRDQAGTLFGELRQSARMFLSFAATLPMLYGYRVAPQWRSDRKAAGALYFGALLTTLTIGGAIAIQMRAVRDAKDLQDMDDPKFWQAAFLQGGGLGIYGDFVFGNLNRMDRSLGETMGGAQLGFLSDLQEATIGETADLIQSGGKKGDPLTETTQLLARNMPGSSLWYLKAGYDRVVEDGLKRLTDPEADDAFRRRIANLKRSTGQGYFWRPGQLAPDRGPVIAEAPAAQ